MKCYANRNIDPGSEYLIVCVFFFFVRDFLGFSCVWHRWPKFYHITWLIIIYVVYWLVCVYFGVSKMPIKIFVYFPFSFSDPRLKIATYWKWERTLYFALHRCHHKSITFQFHSSSDILLRIVNWTFVNSIFDYCKQMFKSTKWMNQELADVGKFIVYNPVNIVTKNPQHKVLTKNWWNWWIQNFGNNPTPTNND